MRDRQRFDTGITCRERVDQRQIERPVNIHSALLAADHQKHPILAHSHCQYRIVLDLSII